jgi:hypothetical protein
MPRLLLIAIMLFLNTGCKHATAAYVPVDPGFDDYEGYRGLGARDAVAWAEGFVRKMGYTDTPPEPVEDEEWPYDDAWRYTLERRAYGYQHKAAGGPGWTVIFCLLDAVEAADPVGRAVAMDEYGSHIRLVQKEIYLRDVEHRLRECRE